jgi:uncharacterized membrane protein
VISPLRAIDNFLYANVTRRWPQAKVDNYVNKVKAIGTDEVLPEGAHRAFSDIDAKSASLLTHVSMMVAALGITSTVVAETKWEQGFMIVQIMLYLIIAIACLRCSSLFRGVTEENLPQDTLNRELILRREVFAFCNTASIYLTIVVFLSLPIIAYF